jgi:hypothetical protein
LRPKHFLRLARRLGHLDGGREVSLEITQHHSSSGDSKSAQLARVDVAIGGDMFGGRRSHRQILALCNLPMEKL